MRANEFLSETYINLFTPAEKNQYAKEVWDILQKSYASIGGYKGAASIDELVNTDGLWKLAKKNNKIVAVGIYKSQHGRKAIAYGTDGSKEGKMAFRDTQSTDVKLGRSWVEASGAIENILVKSGAVKIPGKYAASLTNKEIINISDDGYHYTRLLQGTPHEKILFGVVNVTSELASKLAQAGLSLYDLPENMLTK